MPTYAAENTSTSTPAIQVVRKGVDKDGDYYDVQIALGSGETLSARHHTSTGSGTDPNSTGNGSAAGTQGSVPVEIIDPALRGDEKTRKIDVDPQALKSAIDRFENEQVLGMLKEQEAPEQAFSQPISSQGVVERERFRDPWWERLWSLDFSLYGSAPNPGEMPREFEANLERTRQQGIAAPAQEMAPPRELPAHVRSMALAALPRTPVSTSDFSQPNGSLPGRDFAHKSTVAGRRTPSQEQRFTAA